jgi:branched-chain amino acid transport system substrate-binding protein
MRQLKIALASAVAVAAVAAAPSASADDVKLGVLLGFSGPLEALAPPIAAGAELAVAEVNEQGGLKDGKLVAVRGDSTCADATAAANAADRLINSEKVLAIVGAMCSGATISAANTAGIPTNTVMVSPSATAPAISTLEDNDLLFRTAPSDAYQGEVMARLLMSKGIDNVAVTYVNNDYGKGLAETFSDAFAADGGTIAAKEAHEEGKADYRAELGSLAASGAPTLVIIAYAQGSGQTILRQATETGDFVTFVGADGMISDDLFKGIDTGAVEGMIGTKPASPDIPGAKAFKDLANAAGVDPTQVYAPEAYDAAFLLALAMEKNGAKRDGLSAALRAVASAPGETIMPGDWKKAKDIIDGGGDVNYEGATGSVDFDTHGDVAGYVLEMTVENGKWVECGRCQ